MSFISFLARGTGGAVSCMAMGAPVNAARLLVPVINRPGSPCQCACTSRCTGISPLNQNEMLMTFFAWEHHCKKRPYQLTERRHFKINPMTDSGYARGHKNCVVFDIASIERWRPGQAPSKARPLKHDAFRCSRTPACEVAATVDFIVPTSRTSLCNRVGSHPSLN